jgi:hypothetical protein
VNHVSRLSDGVGNVAEAQRINRLCLVPGMAHCNIGGTVSSTAGPSAGANAMPLAIGNEFFNALLDRVENAAAPTRRVLDSSGASTSLDQGGCQPRLPITPTSAPAGPGRWPPTSFIWNITAWHVN